MAKYDKVELEKYVNDKVQDFLEDVFEESYKKFKIKENTETEKKFLKNLRDDLIRFIAF